MNAPLRKSALRRYLVFRVKAVEMMDMYMLHQSAAPGALAVPNPGGRMPKDFAESLRAPLLSWFALLIDNNAVDVISLWRELFPKHRNEIETTWARIQPAFEILRDFRDRVGFHADKPRPFFLARRAIIANQEMLDKAVGDFRTLFFTLVAAEASELPDLEPEVDEFLDAVESELRVKYDRAELKRYLAIRSHV